jgi:hypothetical protein
LRTRRAKQGQVALALDRFPQLALHQRGLEDPGQFGNAAAIGGEIQPAAGIAVDFHGAHGLHARRVQVAPGAQFVEKSRIGRADRINPRIQGFRKTGAFPSTRATDRVERRKAAAMLKPARPPPTIRTSKFIAQLSPTGPRLDKASVRRG